MQRDNKEPNLVDDIESAIEQLKTITNELQTTDEKDVETFEKDAIQIADDKETISAKINKVENSLDKFNQAFCLLYPYMINQGKVVSDKYHKLNILMHDLVADITNFLKKNATKTHRIPEMQHIMDVINQHLQSMSQNLNGFEHVRKNKHEFIIQHHTFPVDMVLNGLHAMLKQLDIRKLSTKRVLFWSTQSQFATDLQTILDKYQKQLPSEIEQTRVLAQKR